MAPVTLGAVNYDRIEEYVTNFIEKVQNEDDNMGNQRTLYLLTTMKIDTPSLYPKEALVRRL